MATSDQLSDLRALVVGSGWGRHAAEVFARDQRTQLAGLVGRGSERTRLLATRLGVPLFLDLDLAIEDTNPTLAMVAAHESANGELVGRLIDAGVHVLCAHPVVPSAGEVKELIARGEARGSR